MYMSNIFLYDRKMVTCRQLELPTSFSKSVCCEVLSFACLIVYKVSWVQGRVAGSLTVDINYDIQIYQPELISVVLW